MAEREEGKEVFGRLPHRRPGIESPRRARAREGGASRPSPASGEPHAPEEPSAPGELEQLARAGVKLAGGVTAAGLRFAGRAAGGLGRVVGRR